MQRLLTKILKSNLKISNGQERSSKRKCSKCKEEKPLNNEYFQVVRNFKSGFSYYCNVCDKPPKKEV
jgi:hypothetical protein